MADKPVDNKAVVVTEKKADAYTEAAREGGYGDLTSSPYGFRPDLDPGDGGKPIAAPEVFETVGGQKFKIVGGVRELVKDKK